MADLDPPSLENSNHFAVAQAQHPGHSPEPPNAKGVARAMYAFGVLPKRVAAVATSVAADLGRLLAGILHQPRALAPALQNGAAAIGALSRPVTRRTAYWQETQQQY